MINDFKYFMTAKGVKIELVFAPNSWDENSDISYNRSNDYFGIMRAMGIPFEYVQDGALIIRNAMYSGGLETVVNVEVQQLNRATMQYEVSFTGEIDLSEFEDDNGLVSVALIEGGASKNIKAYEGVEYEINLVGSDVVKMILPGVALAESGEGIFIKALDGDRDDYIPETLVTTDDMSSGFAENHSAEKSGNHPNFATSDSYFLSATRSLSMKMSINLNGAFTSFPPSTGTFEIRNQTGAIIHSENLGTGTGIQFNRSFNFEFDTVVGFKYFFYFATTRAGTILAEGDYKISYSSRADASECLGLRAYDIYNRLIQKMTPGTTAVSYLLSNKWKNLIFTSGDAIRQNAKPKINMSFKDFFKTVNGIEDAGFGVERRNAILELATYFARDIESANVGDVSVCKIKPAKDFIFNSFKVGYDDGNTDETNGKQEYNSTQIWYNPITRINKEKDWISPTRADQFGIEYIRTEVIKEPTSDNADDNKPFMIDCFQDGDVYRPILGDVYQQVTGLTDPETAYNLALTPKKNLLRHSGYIRSMLDKMEDKYVNFGSGNKNTELKTVFDSFGVKENENILVGSLSGKYFIPYIAEIRCKMPIGVKKLFDNNPYGYIRFSYRGVTLKGYIMSVVVDLANNQEQEFKLLLTKDNDLLKLLKYA